MTAGELMAELEADPEWVAERDRREAEMAARQAELRRAEAPLVAELRELGYAVDSAWDMYKYKPYEDAVAVLVRHLGVDYPARVREGIARALNVPAARWAWDEVVAAFRGEQEKGAKDALAVAVGSLCDVGDERQVAEVIELAGDAAHGNSRLLLFETLERSGRADAYAVLERAAEDSTVSAKAQEVLRRWPRPGEGVAGGQGEARWSVEGLVASSAGDEPWVRARAGGSAESRVRGDG
ncbi:hypothetical protein [Haloechinothrix sp. LS1_15]|uniref:hypothetical protein n=1 Tax=Haloechinothrix sp. LS1_15 TaxID=2652248 RepID=UPI0029463557|nr:hypothetical protein [Haloechinothrix sp. LS1_15]MDV6014395.1 hypothetical protein [Haloechinothrix sp. LS1_15]